MTLKVHPDPQQRAGGYAFLELPEASLPDGAVTVMVFDAYGERWLAPSEEPGGRIGIGNANWQADPVEFGPYDVHRHDGADWVRIGPEIVNKLDEYAALRLVVNGQSHDVTWPDSVPPRAGAAVLGGLKPVMREQGETVQEPVVVAPVIDAAPEPETDMHLPAAEEPGPAVPPEGRGGGRLVLTLLLSALVIVAALAWYFWPDKASEPAVVTEVTEETCTPVALAAIPGGFGDRLEAIRACGAELSADAVLSLIEEAAAGNDPVALRLFGTLYDGEDLDPRIENLIGLSFDDDPARAAEYYHRAVEAGSGPAKDLLAATCERLSKSDATLSKGAYDDFCS